MADSEEFIEPLKKARGVWITGGKQTPQDRERIEHAFVLDSALDEVTLEAAREALVAAIKNLPEREQFVMSMYYEHDMNLKEIAAVLVKARDSRKTPGQSAALKI